MDFPILPEEDLSVPEVDFFSENIDFELPDQSQHADWLISVASDEGTPFFELSIIYCSDEHLRDINVEYLDHDYYTDIITFPHSDNAVHGDLFISIDRVQDNAQTNGVAFEEELRRVMVHGVLHLCGYGDKSEEEARLMRSKEDHYLQTYKQSQS
ncbi:MAG: rRNA maturation RNase YbeY [Saprospiraceae bacterium]